MMKFSDKINVCRPILFPYFSFSCFNDKILYHKKKYQRKNIFHLRKKVEEKKLNMKTLNNFMSYKTSL